MEIGLNAIAPATKTVALGSAAVEVTGLSLRKLTQLIERLNPGYLLVYGNEGDMAHKDVMRSIELLGKEVIPALHAIKLHPYE